MSSGAKHNKRRYIVLIRLDQGHVFSEEGKMWKFRLWPQLSSPKVCEPSILHDAAEPSTITTVVNTAAVTATKAADEQLKKEPKEELEEEEQPKTYVHKLKKAWIKAYNEDDQPAVGKLSF